MNKIGQTLTKDFAHSDATKLIQSGKTTSQKTETQVNDNKLGSKTVITRTTSSFSSDSASKKQRTVVTSIDTKRGEL